MIINVGGKKYDVKYGIKALMKLEEEFNAPITEIANKFQSNKFGITDLFKIFAAGFITKHPEVEKEEIINIIDELGLKEVSDIVAKAFNEAFNTDKKVKEKLENF